MFRKFLHDKRNKFVVWIFIFVVCIVSIIISNVSRIISNIGIDTEVVKSTLSNRPVVFVDEYYEDERLPRNMKCPNMNYTMWMPEDVTVTNGVLNGTYNDIDYVVMISGNSFDEMIEEKLPNEIVFPVFGYEPKVQILQRERAYFYEYLAEYAATSVSTKASIRTVTSYGLTLCLMLETDTYLYIYTSVEDQELLAEAKSLMNAIGFSVRAIEQEIEETVLDEPVIIKEEDYVERDPYAGEYAYNIYLEHELNTDIKDGVFVFEWMNVEAHPAELIIYSPDGEQLQKLEDYSVEGHYAYAIDEAMAGTYIVEGHTIEQITGVVMSVYNKEDYLVFMGYEDRTDYAFSNMR